MDILEQQALHFKENKGLQKVASQAKQAKEWSADLLSGAKGRADLEKMLESLESSGSFSLLFGYFRESVFCPVILTVKKTQDGFELKTFCVDDNMGDRGPVKRTWEFKEIEPLVDCLLLPIPFVQEPSKTWA